MRSVKIGNLTVRTFKIAPDEIIPDSLVNNNSTWINVEDLITTLDDIIDTDDDVDLLRFIDYKTGLMALVDVFKVELLNENNLEVLNNRFQKGQLNNDSEL